MAKIGNTARLIELAKKHPKKAIATAAGVLIGGYFSLPPELVTFIINAAWSYFGG